jgi:hypothetical protein
MRHDPKKRPNLKHLGEYVDELAADIWDMLDAIKTSDDPEPLRRDLLKRQGELLRALGKTGDA